jgi:hypothetical protein
MSMFVAPCRGGDRRGTTGRLDASPWNLRHSHLLVPAPLRLEAGKLAGRATRLVELGGPARVPGRADDRPMAAVAQWRGARADGFRSFDEAARRTQDPRRLIGVINFELGATPTGETAHRDWMHGVGWPRWGEKGHGAATPCAGRQSPCGQSSRQPAIAGRFLWRRARPPLQKALEMVRPAAWRAPVEFPS